MNYDNTNIPANYDRGRDHGPELLSLWMKTLSGYVGEFPVRRVLDLGCGTGRFTEALAENFAAQVVGVDPSSKMLAQAMKKRSDSRVRYQTGQGEAIPLADGSVDLIFMSMSFHHFTDPLAAARECHRVLREDGFVFLRGGSRDRISSYVVVDFFPASRSIMERDLPTTAFMQQTFAAAGFRTIACELITQQIAANYQNYADKLAVGADSVLAQLSASDFDAGIAAMRAFDGEPSTVKEPIDFLVFRRNTMPDLIS
jgi:ubiquinone/menaquinone biosynthesis C-methylase UbiE